MRPVILIREVGKDGGIEAGRHLEDEHAVVQLVQKDGHPARFFAAEIVEGLAVAHDGDRGEIHARKGVVAARPRLFGAGTQNDVAVEHDANAERPVVRAEAEGIKEVAAGIRIAKISGLLRPRQDDGLSAPLDEVGKRRRGIGHRIRAVRHHKAVEGAVVLLDDGSDLQPVGIVDVRAVQIEGLHRLHRAELSDLGHAGQELLRSERGAPAPSPVFFEAIVPPVAIISSFFLGLEKSISLLFVRSAELSPKRFNGLPRIAQIEKVSLRSEGRDRPTDARSRKFQKQGSEQDDVLPRPDKEGALPQLRKAGEERKRLLPLQEVPSGRNGDRHKNPRARRGAAPRRGRQTRRSA